MHLGANPDSVVPTGLDLGATLIPGLKPGVILFRPFGTEFARGATTCPRSDRRAAPRKVRLGLRAPPRGQKKAPPGFLRIPGANDSAGDDRLSHAVARAVP